MKDVEDVMAPPRGCRHHRGFSMVEVMVALLIIALVVASVSRVNVTMLSLIGSASREPQQGARLRYQAVAWIQAVTEYSRTIGFKSLAASCASYPCSFWIPSALSGATPPYDRGPALPSEFQCGRVLLTDWDGAGALSPGTQLQLVTMEIYRVTCAAGGSETPFLRMHTGMAAW